MEFDIGNLLYIIITLVAISLGLLGRKKKQQPGGGPASGEGESRPGFLESLERTLNQLGQEEMQVMDLREYEADLTPEEVEFEQPVGEVHAEEETVQTMTDSYAQMLKRMSQRGEDPILAEGQAATEPIEVIDLDQQEGVDYFQAIKDFDAGTAVVYAAIINRLDY